MNNMGNFEHRYKEGDVIGGECQVRKVLGAGGFGVVYLVNHLEIRSLYALKTIRAELLADVNARRAFQQEALVWVQLDEHPSILPARWVVEFSDQLFVAMDYVEPDTQGRVNLYDHLRGSHPLSAERILEWAIQFCLGMEHANAHGVKCHRDIKPANILISKGDLKITDFGLAAAAEVAWKEKLGVSGSLITAGAVDGFGFSMSHSDGRIRCGTPGYMPPEVYRSESADVRSDIYSFGLVLWQMATGSVSPPFVKSSYGDVECYMREAYERQMKGHIPPVAGPLRPVIERCLVPDPTKRYYNFGEMRDVLDTIFQNLSGRRVTIPITNTETVVFWGNKGASFVALGRYEEAIRCFRRALDIDPRDAATWVGQGAALAELGRCDEAILSYDRALAIDPRDALAWMNKGKVVATLGRKEEALVYYDEALGIDPQYPKIWYNKGIDLGALDRRNEAIACYDNSSSRSR